LRPTPGEALLDSPLQHVAHLAVGVQALLAAALRHRRIRRRPILDAGRERAGEIERLVVRLRRQRDDQVEIEPLPFLQLLERDRSVLGDVDPDLVHGGDRERIELPLRTPAGCDVGRHAKQLAEQARGHRRAHRVEPADEQHRCGRRPIR